MLATTRCKNESETEQFRIMELGLVWDLYIDGTRHDLIIDLPAKWTINSLFDLSLLFQPSMQN